MSKSEKNMPCLQCVNEFWGHSSRKGLFTYVDEEYIVVEGEGLLPLRGRLSVCPRNYGKARRKKNNFWEWPPLWWRVWNSYSPTDEKNWDLIWFSETCKNKQLFFWNFENGHWAVHAAEFFLVIVQAWRILAIVNPDALWNSSMEVLVILVRIRIFNSPNSSCLNYY